ncbi:Galactinol--sucrose galactosyltransferase [Linum perenne]
MLAGDDPYSLLKDAVKAIKSHLGTFKLLEEKSPPEIVDKFGWCTWDAFYLKVNPKGVWEGVRGLVEGGCPPGMVLIDDGWQSICHDDDPITDREGMNRTAAGEQMPCRSSKWGKGMGAFVKDLKEGFKSVEFVYVWHALCGYWGGIRPGVPGLPESKVVAPKLSEGNGVGLVPPQLAYKLYEGIHSHLHSAGIDGVKVDVIHVSSSSKLHIHSYDFNNNWIKH